MTMFLIGFLVGAIVMCGVFVVLFGPGDRYEYDTDIESEPQKRYGVSADVYARMEKNGRDMSRYEVE